MLHREMYMMVQDDMIFMILKKMLLSFLNNMGLHGNFIENEKIQEEYLHPYRAINLFLGKEHIASFGVLKPEISHAYGIKDQEVLVAEIFSDKLPISLNKKPKKYISIDYPVVYRDFAFLLEKQIQVDKLVRIISKVNRKYISDVRVFDVYEGEGVPEQMKSVGIEVKILPQKTSLTEEEIQEVCNSIISSVKEKSGAILRE